MNKYQTWWDSLPKHTQEYLKAQPIWHDRELWCAFAVGIAFGFVLGIIMI